MSEAQKSGVPRRPYVPPTIEPLGKMAGVPPGPLRTCSEYSLVCDSPTLVWARPLDEVQSKTNQEP